MTYVLIIVAFVAVLLVQRDVSPCVDLRHDEQRQVEATSLLAIRCDQRKLGLAPSIGDGLAGQAQGEEASRGI